MEFFIVYVILLLVSFGNFCFFGLFTVCFLLQLQNLLRADRRPPAGGTSLRQVLQQAADMPPDGLRQKGRVQVALLSEVVDGSAVEEHRGAVHGNALPNP